MVIVVWQMTIDDQVVQGRDDIVGLGFVYHFTDSFVLASKTMIEDRSIVFDSHIGKAMFIRTEDFAGLHCKASWMFADSFDVRVVRQVEYGFLNGLFDAIDFVEISLKGFEVVIHVREVPYKVYKIVSDRQSRYRHGSAQIRSGSHYRFPYCQAFRFFCSLGREASWFCTVVFLQSWKFCYYVLPRKFVCLSATFTAKIYIIFKSSSPKRIFFFTEFC